MIGWNSERDYPQIDNTICCNASCLWTDGLLRGYIIDTEDKSIKGTEEEISLREIEDIKDHRRK